MSSIPAQEKAALKISQAAKILKISRSTLLRLEEAGHINSSRLDNGYRTFSLEDVLKLKDNLQNVKQLIHEEKQIVEQITPEPAVIEKEQAIEPTIILQEKSQDKKSLFSKNNFNVFAKASFATLLLLLSFSMSNNDIASNKLLAEKLSKIKIQRSVKADADVLASFDTVKNYSFNVKVPANFLSNVTVDGVLSTPTLNDVLNINATTENTFEQNLEIAGEVISNGETGLTDVIIADGVIDGNNLVDNLSYDSTLTTNGLVVNENLTSSGTLFIDGTWEIDGTEVTATAEELNSIGSLNTTVIDGITTTAGGVYFADGSKLAQDATNFFWNDTTNSLGIGTNAPTSSLHIAGTLNVTGTTTLNGVSYTWPGADGTAGQILTTNGSGTLSWVSPAGGGTVDGTGTANYVPLWSDSDTLTSSVIYESGGNIGIGTTTPAASLHVYGQSIFGDNGAALNSGSNIMAISEYSTDNATRIYALQAGITSDPTSTLSAQRYGVFGLSTITNGNTQNVTGRQVAVQGQFEHRGTGTLTEADGFRATYGNYSTGIITNGKGLATNYTNSGTIVNNYGVHVIQGTNTGTIQNNYGIYIDNVTNGTNDYAIYSAGGNSYFAGNIGIGTTNPLYELDINGSARIASTGDLYIGNIGLGDTGANATLSGATLVGVYDEFSNSNATNVQEALNDLDAAIGSGASKFTQGTGLIYLTNTTDELIIGGTASLSSKFAIDGDSDETQLLIQGNSSQTANLAVIENSSGSDLLAINAYGDLLSGFTQLDGTDTANGSGSNTNTLILNDASDFEVGNYVQVSSANCHSSLSTCYSKIRQKVSNTLTLHNNLSWANGATITEYHVPEVGATNTADTLANRYGQGFFISGTVAGNGTTYYGDQAIFTSDRTSADSPSLSITTGNTTTSGNSGDITIDTGTAAGTAGNINIGSTNASTITIGNASSVTTVAGSFELNNEEFADLTGNGLQLISNELTLKLASAADGLSSTTSAGSGLEVLTDGLTLLQGCSNGQILKWNESNDSWECGNDTGATSAVINVENNDVAVGASVDTLDFGSDFTLTASPSNEANIAITDDALNFTEFSDSLVFDSNTNFNLYSGSADVDARFFNSNNANEILFLDSSSGNVGIGTTNPTYKLAVTGAINAGTAANNIEIGGSLTSGWASIQGNSNSSFGDWAIGALDDLNVDNLSISTLNSTADIIFAPDQQEKIRINATGNLGIGSTNPTAMLSIGSANQFTVNSTGNLTRINDVAYSWPASQAAGSNYVLTNNGSGTLSWADIASVGGLDGAGTANYLPLWSDSNTLTSSSLYETGGNVGIGTTAPSSLLHIAGTATATTFTDGTATLSAGTLDLGTNTIYDGNLTGNWALNDGNLTGVNSITADNTITFTGLGTGTDNTVVILNSSNQLTTDEIDSRVWGTSLVDGTGIANYVARYSDTDTLTTGALYDTGTNVGIGTTSPQFTLEIAGNGRIQGSGYMYFGGTGASDSVGYVTTASNYIFLNGTNGAVIRINGSNKYDFFPTVFRPNGNNIVDLGSSTTQWANLWVNGLTATSGNIGIGTTNPAEKFSVGTSSQFRVDSSGNLTRINDVAYSWPASQAAGSNYVLTNNGSGSLTWSDISGVGGLDGSGTANYLPIWSDSNTLATSSIYETSGNIGIGTTNPTVKLQISGTVQATGYNVTDTNYQLQALNNYLRVSGWYGLEVYETNGTDSQIALIDSNGPSYINTGTNFGIGTTNPTSLLQVAGTAAATTFSDGTATLTGGTLDLGTNTIYDGNLTGNWALNDGNLTGVNSITADNTITFTGLGTGTDNTVVILNSSNQLTTDEIDSRVWGTSLVDGSATANYLPYMSDADSLANSSIYYTGGNIGIGTTAPTTTLELASSGTLKVGNTTITNTYIASGANPFYVEGTGSTGLVLRASNASGAITFTSGGTTEYMRLSSTGNLGIGTTNPSAKLSVGASSQFRVDSSGNLTRINDVAYSWPASQAGADNYVLTNDGSGTLTWESVSGAGGLDGSGTANYLPLWSDSNTLTNSSLYETGGNVGIGTTNPQAKLAIGGSLMPKLRINYLTTTYPTNYYTEIYHGGDGGGIQNLGGTQIISQAQVDSNSNNIVFGKQIGSNNPTAQMIIKSNGNVGIGTTNPTSLLQVAGTATATTFSDGTSTLSAGTLDLGTNTIYDGNLTGNWALNDGNLTGVNSITADNTITFTGLGTGTDNTVVILNSSNQLTTDEIDSRVWGTALVDGTATANYLPYMSDSDSLANSSIYYTGGYLGIGTTAPTNTLTIGNAAETAYKSLRINSNTSNSGSNYALDVRDDGAGADAQIFKAAGSYADSYTGYFYRNTGSTSMPMVYIHQDYGFGAPENQTVLSLRQDSSAASSHILDAIGAGNEHVVISSSGSLGIGTTNPSAKLSVGASSQFRVDSSGNLTRINDVAYSWPASQAAGSNYVLTNNGSGTLTWSDISGVGGLDGSGTANYLPIWSDSNTLATSSLYETGGNVGIGTTNPTAKLYVAGAQTVEGTFTVAQGYGASITGATALGNNIGTDSLTIQTGSGSFSVSTGSANNQLYVPSTGNVGIGTTAPSSLLAVGASSQFRVDSSGNLIRINDIAYSWPASQAAADNYVLVNNGSGTLTWESVSGVGGLDGSGTANYLPIWSDSNTLASSSLYETGGNIGIGTTAPEEELSIYSTDDIFAGVQFSSSTVADNYAIGIGDGDPFSEGLLFTKNGSQQAFMNANGNWGFGGYAGNAASDVSIYGGMSIGSTYVNTAAPSNGAIIQGNVGIGTTNPSAMLGIGSSSQFRVDSSGNLTRINDVAYSWPASQAAADNYVLVNDGSGNLTWETVSGVGGLDGSGTANYLPLWSDSNSLTSSSIYETGGNIGIGTTAPSEKLEINGNLALTTNYLKFSYGSIKNGDSTGFLAIRNAADNGYAALQASSVYAYATVYSPTLYHDGSAGLNISATNASGDIKFNTAGTEKLRIKNSGNVGIGTTNPTSLLHVAGTATATTFSDGTATLNSGTLDLGTNTIYDGNMTGNWALNDGNITGVNSITADNTITFTGLGTGTDNTVVILNSSNQLTTDEIDARVWGTSLIDGTGTANYVARYSDTDTLTTGTLYDTGTNVGIGTTAPSVLLELTQAADNAGIKINGYDDRSSSNLQTYIADTGTSKIVASDALTLIPTNGAFFIDASQDIYMDLGDSSGSRKLRLRDSGSNEITTIDSDGNGYFAGNIGIGTTSPSAKLSVGATSQFRVDSSGNLTRINDVAYSWPASQAAADNYVLVNDGSGTLTWEAVSGVGAIDGSGTANYLPLWSDSNTLTSSALYENSGNIGIGTTAPSSKLHVASGNITTNYALLAEEIIVNGKYALQNASGALRIGNSSGWTSGIQFYGGASEVARFNSSGYLGIGTTTPSSLLHVAGTATATTFSDGTASLSTGTLDLGTNTIYDGNLTGNWALNDGNITGVNSITADSTITFTGLGTGTDNTVVILNSSNQLTTDEIDSRVWGTTLVDGTGTANYLPYMSDADSLANSSVYYTGGNVGIGTTNPLVSLDVNGAIYARSGIKTTQIDSSWIGAGTDITLSAGSSGSLIFKNGTTEALRVASSGNVGIGSTTPASLLSVGASNQFQVDSNGDIVKLNNVTYAWPNAQAGADNYVLVNDGNGTLNWESVSGAGGLDGSGTTNYLPLWSDSNTLTSSGLYQTGGNIGIGTTNPLTILHINGGTGTIATGLSFGDGDSGIYESSDDALRIHAGTNSTIGINAGYVRNEDLVSWSLMNEGPTATNPIFSYYTDTDTGIGRASENVLSLIAGGVNGLNVNGSGYVGIGTTNPTSLLHVAGTATATTFSDGTATLTSGTLDLGTNTIYDGNLTGNWNFNSGNLSAIADLSTTGTITATGLGTGTDNSVVILNSSNQLTTDEIDSRVWGTSLVDGSGTANYLPKFSDNDTLSASMIYDTGTAIGIGTTNPGVTTLYVAGTATVTSSVNTSSYLLSSVASLGYSGTELRLGAHSFWQSQSLYTNGSKRVTIDSSGNVGIGTTNPSALLSAGATSQFRVDSSGNLTRINDVAYSWPGSQAGADNYVLTNDGSGNLTWESVGSVGGLDGTGTANYLPLWNDSNTLTSSTLYENSGNIGIGTTSPSSALHILKTSAPALSLQYSTGQLGASDNVLGSINFGGLETNGGQDGDNYASAIIKATTDYLGWASSTEPAALSFWTTPSSTTTALERMRITNAGYIGIGTTSPAQMLHVAKSGAADIAAFTTDTPGGGTLGAGLKVSAIWEGRPALVPTYKDGSAGTTLALLGAAGQQIHLVNSNRIIDTPATGASGTGSYIGIKASNGTIITGVAPTTAVTTLEIAGVSGQTGDLLNITSYGGSYGDLLTIDSSGNMGIGTTAPASKLQIAGSVTPTTNNSYDLGTAALQWNDLFLGGNLDLGTNTLYDGNLTGNWALNDGNLTGVNSITADNTITLTGLSTGTDNTVVILNSSNQLTTDEIDARVWGTSLTDGAGTQNYMPLWSDADSLTTANIYQSSNNIGIGGTAPATSPVLYVANGGTVGIGTTNPSEKLSIVAGSTTPMGITRTSAGQWISFNDGTDAWGLYNYHGSPEGNLTANTGALAMDTTNGTLYVKTDDSDATGWTNLATGTSTLWTDAGTYIKPDNVGTIAITDTGYIGIGTTTPSFNLEVKGGAYFVNQATEGNTGVEPLLIATGGPNTKGLAIRATSYTSTTFTPSTVSGLTHWYKADAIVGLSNGDQVDTWEDQSTANNDATQTTSTNKPTYQTNILNGKPVVRFDSTNDYLTFSSFSTDPATMFVVYDLNGAVSSQRGVVTASTASYGGTTGLYYYDSGKACPRAQWGTSSGSCYSDAGLFDTDAKIVDVIYTSGGDNPAVYLDGTSITRDFADGWGPQTISNNRIGENLGGDIAEIIIYSGSLSTTDREKVEGYLAHKYDLDGNLPGGHTYKSSDPGNATTYNQAANLLELQDPYGDAYTVFNSSGYLGIGTTNPSQKLEVAGGFLLGNNTGTGQINTSDWDISTTGDLTGIGAITADGTFTASTGTSNAMALTRSSAGQWMSFNDGTDSWGLYNYAGSPEGGLAANTGALAMDTTNGTLYVKTDDTDNTGWVNLATGGSSQWSDAGAYIYANNATNTVVTDNGYIGIGTTAPSGEFQIAGTTPQIWLGDAGAEDTSLVFDGNAVDFYMGLVDANDDLIFGTGSTIGSSALFTIENGGNIGIGTTAPSASLHVIDTTEQLRLGYDTSNYSSFTIDSAGNLTLSDSGTNVATFGATGASFEVPTSFNAVGDVSIANDIQFTDQTSSFIKSYAPLTIESGESYENNNLTLTTYGTGNIVANMGVGTTGPNALVPGMDAASDLGSSSYRWRNVYASNGTIQTSDANLKENIIDLNYGLAEILRLRPVSYNWIDHPEEGNKVGLLAQETSEVIPEAVAIPGAQGGYWGIRYTDLIPVLIKGMQEQQAQIDALTNNTDENETSTTTEMYNELVALFDEIKGFVSALGLSVTTDENGNESLTINTDLNVLGDTTLGNVVMTGDLSLGVLQINSLENSISTIAQDEVLKLQNYALAGNIDAFNGKIILEPDGTINAEKIVAGAYAVKENSQTIGSGMIETGETEAVIENTNVKSESKIFVTATTSTFGNALYVSDKVDGEKFVVSIDSSVNEDIKFDWWIVDVEEN